MLEFYKGKKVLVTGSTGFKGSWLCKMLLMAGAEVTGYALEPNTEPSLFELFKLDNQMNNVIADIRDYDTLAKVYRECSPDVIFHLAAQPLVIDSYKRPAYTYETNVMGTVNILECVRTETKNHCSVINVTTDKVYKNLEQQEGYVEGDTLDGYEPYSNSKSCSELVTASYRRSFLDEAKIPVSTMRAGNVIGGGDFAENRIIPDCIRALSTGQIIDVRNPNSVRPYQHVIEPLYAYMLAAKMQYDDMSIADTYNIGPEAEDCVTTGYLAGLVCDVWGEGAKWQTANVNGPHEMNFLKLDCAKAKDRLKWSPKWDVKKAIEKTVEFSKERLNSGDINNIAEKQVNEYI